MTSAAGGIQLPPVTDTDHSQTSPPSPPRGSLRRPPSPPPEDRRATHRSLADSATLTRSRGRETVWWTVIIEANLWSRESLTGSIQTDSLLMTTLWVLRQRVCLTDMDSVRANVDPTGATGRRLLPSAPLPPTTPPPVCRALHTHYTGFWPPRDIRSGQRSPALHASSPEHC